VFLYSIDAGGSDCSAISSLGGKTKDLSTGNITEPKFSGARAGPVMSKFKYTAPGDNSSEISSADYGQPEIIPFCGTAGIVTEIRCLQAFTYTD